MEKYSVKNIYNSIPAEQRGKTEKGGKGDISLRPQKVRGLQTQGGLFRLQSMQQDLFSNHPQRSSTETEDLPRNGWVQKDVPGTVQDWSEKLRLEEQSWLWQSGILRYRKYGSAGSCDHLRIKSEANCALTGRKERGIAGDPLIFPKTSPRESKIRNRNQ